MSRSPGHVEQFELSTLDFHMRTGRKKKRKEAYVGKNHLVDVHMTMIEQ